MRTRFRRKTKLALLTGLTATAVLSTAAWAGGSGWQPAGGGPPLYMQCWTRQFNFECEPHGVCTPSGGGYCTQKCIFDAFTGQLSSVSCDGPMGSDW